MKKWLVLLATVLLVACAPATAPATATVQPSSTDQPTATPQPTETQEPTALPSPTATPDVRVFNFDPHDLLLSWRDLPEDAKYYLPNSGWISPQRNSEMLSSWGVQVGQEYITRTGRVDSWWAAYKRGTSQVVAPQEMYNQIVLYQSASGAQLVISDDTLGDQTHGGAMCGRQDRADGYVIVDRPRIGDLSVACQRLVMQASGRQKEWYRFSFVFRNVLETVEGYGWESEVELEYVEAVAMTLYQKLLAAPLSDVVTIRP